MTLKDLLTIFKLETLSKLGLAKLKDLVLAKAKAIFGATHPSGCFCELLQAGEVKLKTRRISNTPKFPVKIFAKF